MDAKTSLEYVRVLVWPMLIGISFFVIRGDILQRPRYDAWATSGGESLAIDAQRNRLDEDVAAILQPRNDAEPIVNTAVTQNDAPPADNIREKTLLSEDLVMRRIGAQYSVAVRRQVAIGPQLDLQFDGAFEHLGNTTLVEVQYIIDDGSLRELIDTTMSHFDKAGSEMRADRQSFLLVLVADMPDIRQKAMEMWVAGLVETSDRRLKIRVYGFDQLSEQFGVTIKH